MTTTVTGDLYDWCFFISTSYGIYVILGVLVIHEYVLQPSVGEIANRQ